MAPSSSNTFEDEQSASCNMYCSGEVRRTCVRIQPLRFTDVEHVDYILDIAVEQTGVVPREFVPLTKHAECTSFDVLFEMVNASPASEQSRCFFLFFAHPLTPLFVHTH